MTYFRTNTVILANKHYNNNDNNNNNNNNLRTYCVQLNMRMISCTLQLHHFTRNKQKIMHLKK